jgi:hypothetical protein
MYVGDKRKHIVRERITEIDLEGELGEAIRTLEDLWGEYKHTKNYLRLEIVLEEESFCYECPGYHVLVLYGNRKENDKERQNRLREEKKKREKEKESLKKKKERLREEAEELGMKVLDE